MSINLNQENQSRIFVAAIAMPIILVSFLEKNLLITLTIFITLIALFEISLQYTSKVRAWLNAILCSIICLSFVEYFSPITFLFINLTLLSLLTFILLPEKKTFFGIRSICYIYALILGSNLLFCAIKLPGVNYFLIIIITAFTTDTFAFLIGKLFGKRQLSKKYSKNKTIEGALGGWIAGTLTTVLLIGIVDISIDNNLYFLIIITLPIVCQIGDIFSSIIKRTIGVKDFSNFLLGHGGFLDRLDSIISSTIYINSLFILELL